MSGAQLIVCQSVMRHQQQHARSSGDACQRASKQTDERPNINQQAKNGRASKLSQNIHRSLTCAKILPNGVEAQYLGVGANREKGPA